jgi:hypothetical protein
MLRKKTKIRVKAHRRRAPRRRKKRLIGRGIF